MEFGLGTRGGFAIVVLSGVVVPGLANYFLSMAGLGTLGSAVWALGYGAMAVVLWYGWVRPLDLTGPEGSAGLDPDEEDDPDAEAEAD